VQVIKDHPNSTPATEILHFEGKEQGCVTAILQLQTELSGILCTPSQSVHCSIVQVDMINAKWRGASQSLNYLAYL
jgi:hypothetical protein